MSDTEAQSTGYASQNTGYLNDSFTMMRIDARELIAELEAFYRGTRITGWREENNDVVPTFNQFGTARMNEKGLQDMMSWLKSLVNPQTVQGNMTDIDLSNYLADVQADLSTNLMENLQNYDIKESDYNGIVDKTMHLITPFFTRMKDNLERESYAQTTRSVETMSERNKGFSLNPFRRS